MIHTLKNLPGLKRKYTEAFYFKSVTGMKKAIKNYTAGTTSGDNGALNVWIDDQGMIRCMACRYLTTIDEQKFDTVKAASEWTEIWLQKIK